MKIKLALIYTALMAASFGLLLIFLPTWFLSLFGISLSTEGIFFIRIFGASLFGYGVIAWFAKDDPPSETRRHVLLGETVHSTIATIIWVIGLIAGYGNLLMIIPFLVHLSLAIWLGYLYIKGAK